MPKEVQNLTKAVGVKNNEAGGAGEFANLQSSMRRRENYLLQSYHRVCLKTSYLGNNLLFAF